MSDLLPHPPQGLRAAAAEPPLRLDRGGGAAYLLARIEYGQDAGPHSASPAHALRVPLPVLGNSPASEEWLVNEPPLRETAGVLRLASAGDLLFGAATLAMDELDADALEAGTADLYRQLLRACELRDRRPLRIWNSMPAIHVGPAELNRYMRFCKGRADAFEDHYGRGFERYLPACSAVGSAGGPLVVSFLASAERSRHLENPRQQAAYRYPRRYGPRSPSFARATQAAPSAGAWLMLSGTASIVGNASMHAGDVVAQTRETLRNMRMLVHGDEHRPLGSRIAATKVYLRHAADFETVRGILDDELGTAARVLYLRADICRPELLVEIEGIAHPVEPQP